MTYNTVLYKVYSILHCKIYDLFHILLSLRHTDSWSVCVCVCMCVCVCVCMHTSLNTEQSNNEE